jgi:WD40 repeat protein
LWSVATHREIGRPLTGDTGAVLSVAFSPNGKILASGSADHTIRLWSVATHREIGRPLTADTEAVNSVAFSPNGKILASGSADDTIRLWSVATHLQIGRPLTGDTDAVNSVAFSPNGATLASGSNDDTIRFWSVSTHSQTGLVLAEQGRVQDVAYSPDGATLADIVSIPGTSTSYLQIWDITTGAKIGPQWDFETPDHIHGRGRPGHAYLVAPVDVRQLRRRSRRSLRGRGSELDAG